MKGSELIIKKVKFGLVFLIILYLLLNFWAINKVEIDTSAESILNSISNANFNTGILKTELGTELRLRNPTIIPILIPKISYDFSYSNSVIGDGSTGFIFIGPKSYIDTPINFKLNHVDTTKSVIDGIINIFKKEKKSLKMSFYVGYDPIRLHIAKIE